MRRLLVLPIALLLAVPAVLAEPSREASDTYVAGGDCRPHLIVLSLCGVEPSLACDRVPATEEDGVAACFEILEGESRVDLRIEDAAGMPVRGRVFFHLDDQSPTWRPLCGSEVTLDIPEGATLLQLEIGPVRFLEATLIFCNGIPSAPATRGVVHATFT